MKTTALHRAVISVSDKRGIEDFARFLAERGVELLSTGGTFKALEKAGVKALEISEYTDSKEVMGGRVKTLHPRVHGGILAKRNEEHLADLESLGGLTIDLVVVNLYPFERVTASPGCAIPDAVENIDIGGPSMVRSAAKNFEAVTVVVSPGDYAPLMKEIETEGGVTPETRFRLAKKAFRRTAEYDAAISRYFSRITVRSGDLVRNGGTFPEFLPLFFRKKQDLRYGENPQQEAAFYGEDDRFLSALVQHHGKELSFNNIMDLNAAWSIVCELPEPGCAVIKHTNPCGAGLGTSALEAFERARVTDPLSSFGGIVTFNVPCDAAAAEAMKGIFLEIVAAPSFDDEALEILKKKKNLRIVTLRERDAFPGWDFRRVAGGLLVQTQDLPGRDEKREIVTRRKPTDEETNAMELAWTVCKHVKSNAIVIGDSTGTVGVGAGQMSRVDSVKIARMKAYRDTAGCVAASDAFFPFPDGIEELAAAGVTAVIQPGGSIRDKVVIEAADKAGMVMVFSGTRHFKHG